MRAVPHHGAARTAFVGGLVFKAGGFVRQPFSGCRSRNANLAAYSTDVAHPHVTFALTTNEFPLMGPG